MVAPTGTLAPDPAGWSKAEAEAEVGGEELAATLEYAPPAPLLVSSAPSLRPCDPSKFAASCASAPCGL